ncbi:MAG: sigma 54-interacting transcriptional regulator, partial [Pontibacter sp.]|nr:sigma 54-interacting transcriptional regulator [Pontibacter sp.]
FIKVGSSKVQKTDVRVVAATNVNLMKAVEKGTFREDLYYRLNTVPITVPPLRERGDDIYLLFRKFASDFSDKYKVQPIMLTPDAVKELQAFRWPGNIRQLKNIVEQISVLEYEREINAETLRRYLPFEQTSTLPAVLAKDGASEGQISERDLLYKVLFDMRRDMSELKKLVFNMLTHQPDDEDLLREHSHLFENMEPQAYNGRSYQQEPVQNEPYYLPIKHTQPQEYEHDKVEDIPHETEEESLSLEDKEKELILKALKKHNNKRKYAAQDLGISERTLYRKLKQYDIED